MRKILILILGLLSLNAFGQSEAEEAIILNQELQFLEDSVNSVQAMSVKTSDTTTPRNEALNTKSLESTYFGEDTEEDVVNTRTSGPRRRGL